MIVTTLPSFEQAARVSNSMPMERSSVTAIPARGFPAEGRVLGSRNTPASLRRRVRQSRANHDAGQNHPSAQRGLRRERANHQPAEHQLPTEGTNNGTDHPSDRGVSHPASRLCGRPGRSKSPIASARALAAALDHLGASLMTTATRAEVEEALAEQKPRWIARSHRHRHARRHRARPRNAHPRGVNSTKGQHNDRSIAQGFRLLLASAIRRFIREFDALMEDRGSKASHDLPTKRVSIDRRALPGLLAGSISAPPTARRWIGPWRRSRNGRDCVLAFRSCSARPSPTTPSRRSRNPRQSRRSSRRGEA